MAEHYENTCEMSKPHESTAHPETHVDEMAFGKNGERETQYDTDGITDPGSVSLGEETYQYHQRNKDRDNDSDSGK